MWLKGNPCAHNANYRHKLTGLLPGLVMLDDVRMPKNGYRPASPAGRQRSASPSVARSSAPGAASVSRSVDRGAAAGWVAAGAAAAATLGPWGSMPATAPARTLGSVPGARSTPGASNGHHDLAIYAGSARRPASPGPAAHGGKGAVAIVGNHALNASKLSATALSDAPAWIPPNAKYASPAVVAALSGAGARGRNPSSVLVQGGPLRASQQDLKFARMAAGLTSNTSGVERVDSPEKILESLVGSPSSKSSLAASPEKWEKLQQKTKSRVEGLGGGEFAQEVLPLRRDSAASQQGEDKVKILAREIEAKMERMERGMEAKLLRLYECHARDMDVIAQQQALVAALHRDMRIVKSAVTYMNAKINAQDPATLGDAAQDRQISQMAEQLQDTIADMVEARQALVTAMRWADTAQQNKANQDFLKFKEQLEASGLLGSPPESSCGDQDEGGEPRLGLRRAADAAPACRPDKGGGQGHSGGLTHDSPPSARTSKMAMTRGRGGGGAEHGGGIAESGGGTEDSSGGTIVRHEAVGSTNSRTDNDDASRRNDDDKVIHKNNAPGGGFDDAFDVPFGHPPSQDAADSSGQHTHSMARDPSSSPDSHSHSPHPLRAGNPPQQAPQTPPKSTRTSSSPARVPKL